MLDICKTDTYTNAWQLDHPQPGRYALGVQYLGVTNDSTILWMVDANFTIGVLAAPEPITISRSGTYQISSLAPNQILIYQFNPRTLIGDYGHISIMARPSSTVSASATILVLTYTSSGSYASYWKHSGISPYMDPSIALSPSNSPSLGTIPWGGSSIEWLSGTLWRECSNDSWIQVNTDPTYYAALSGLGGTENQFNVTFVFTFEKTCDPDTLCPYYYIGPLASVVIVFIIFVIAMGYSIYQWKAFFASVPEQIRFRSIWSIVLLEVTAIGFFVVLFMPFYYWTSIPQILLIAVYIIGISTLHVNLIFLWAVLSIINVIWMLLFLLFLIIVSVVRGIAESEDAKSTNHIEDEALTITLTMTIINFILVVVNLIVSWTLYRTVKDRPQNFAVISSEAVDLRELGHATE